MFSLNHTFQRRLILWMLAAVITMFRGQLCLKIYANEAKTYLRIVYLKHINIFHFLVFKLTISANTNRHFECCSLLILTCVDQNA